MRKQQYKKKIKSSKDQSLVVKNGKKEITQAFTVVHQHLKQIVRSEQENTNLRHEENEDQKGLVYREIFRVKDKHS